ncbi:histidine decarboxylase [Actinoplanes sp. NPDC051859]|uniref:histidine decarboxylase n=1 Tax=Actinoplanes sp. NPDC051859 TaxID=3363909 RepID=UPI0037AEECF7
MTSSTPTVIAEQALTFDQQVDLNCADIDVPAVLRTLTDRADTAQQHSVGFPGATDIDYSPLVPLLRRLWNNVGDPDSEPGGAAHTMALERAVITWCADLLAMPPADRWGYTTTGGTEGNLAALLTARRRHPGAAVYYSTAAHYSIAKILDITAVPDTDRVLVRSDASGEMDYEHLHKLAAERPAQSAIVVATAGTTMTEACDDTSRILEVLHDAGISRHHLHVDAALAGIPLALDGALRLDDGSGVESIAISGHKFFGTPVPCGLVLMRHSIRADGRQIAYTATRDTTITGSRNGLAAAMLWYAIAKHHAAGHRHRVHAARTLADYTTRRLTDIGWSAWRHPQAFTVVIATPPTPITDKWLLATDGDLSHLVCMPGITCGQIDALIADLHAHAAADPPTTH